MVFQFYKYSMRLSRHFARLFTTYNTNRRDLYFIGQGYQNSNSSSLIKHHFLTNPHIYSPYTPYQAEISQGRLELQYNYQEMVKDITKMDIAIASLIDNGQVGMDILFLMKNNNNNSNNNSTVLIQKDINRALLNCLNTRANHQNINLELIDTNNMVEYIDNNSNHIKGIICQNPSKIGNVNDFTDIVTMAKDKNILTACHTDLISSIYLKPPGDYNFDIAFGNGCNMGIGMNYGGPQPAFMATKRHIRRKLPGRIIGKTIDKYDKEAFRLTWQTREQHIRREAATSNVCTSQSLLACMSVCYAMYTGENNLKKIAANIHHKTTYFYDGIQNHNKLDVLNNNFYDTITLKQKGGYDVSSILYRNNIYPYVYDDNISFTIDETHSINDLNYVLELLNIYNENCNKRHYYINVLPKRNHEKIFTNKVFHTMTDEQNLSRYLYDLGKKDYSLQDGMIPLGSCTMKHTPAEAMNIILDPKYNIHPWVDKDNYNRDCVYTNVIKSLTDKLKEITGFDHVFYQSQSGAMGEYSGLTTIKNYHNYINEGERNIVILPRSSHGTNPISAKLAGYKIVYIKESEGMIDMDDLYKIINKYNSQIAALMITYPSTYGLYEKNIKDINNVLHENGSLIYLDGANMNALMGFQKPTDLGFDICHFNLHKTFSIPHGGGGPGMGPIAMKEFLKPYLPQFSSVKECSSISTSEYGSGLILNISEYYMRHKDESNLKEHHNRVRNNTDNVISSLRHYYNILHVDTQYRAHEFIIDTNCFGDIDISCVDIAKRLMDYHFHAPTMSWPINNSLMIEISETESDEEIERFIDAMIKIKSEINEIREGKYSQENNPLKNSPHTQYDLLDWQYPYSIEIGCFPTKYQLEKKYWPANNRINEDYGDIELEKLFK